MPEFSGIWVVPASPYANMPGVLESIRWARENGRPFLGTCGGFQHALIEFGRNVAGLAGADHAETAPEAKLLLVTRLACSLVGKSGAVRLESSVGARLRRDLWHWTKPRKVIIAIMVLIRRTQAALEKGRAAIHGIRRRDGAVRAISEPTGLASILYPDAFPAQSGRHCAASCPLWSPRLSKRRLSKNLKTNPAAYAAARAFGGQAKMMMPAPVCRRLKTLTVTCWPIRLCALLMTTIVPSLR